MKLLSSIFSWQFPALFHQFLSPTNPTAFCLAASSSFEQLIDCLDGYTVPEDTYDRQTYAAAQPTLSQTSSWIEAIGVLLDASIQINPSCDDLPMPLPISNLYGFSPFHDPHSNTSFCILSETTSIGGSYFTQGWGTFAVRLSTTTEPPTRSLHYSAPHPAFDIDTPQQAAALFKSTHARSLLLSGRSRLSFHEQTPCIQPANPTTVYYRTDPTHDVDEPFFPASMTIIDWQLAQPSSCPSSTCAFIQLHGKRDTTCSDDLAFLSSGIGRSTSSLAWYTDSVDRPIKRIAASARKHFSSHNITIPSDSSCFLVATKNVVGRVLNGVSRGETCYVEATATTAAGMFVHIEQARLSLSPLAYGNWTQVFLDAFPHRTIDTREILP